MRPNALLLWLFGMNGSVFLVFAFGFIWKHHFKCYQKINRGLEVIFA